MLKIWVRLAVLIFCRRIIINHPNELKRKGPLLLACNHPNSFLDAVLLDILFKQPIWSLARGDVFKKPFYIRLLKKLKILPVYRTSEGVENLETNYTTFDTCKEIFIKKGIVLMFSEGKCINEWHLRPLKKGTARLAISAWQDGIDLEVLPVGINYSSFRKFGKNIFINFGAVISKEVILISDTDGKKNLDFNDRLRAELEQIVFEIAPTDRLAKEKLLLVRQKKIWKILLLVPAFTGLLFNAPFYWPVTFFVNSKTVNSDHYDSVQVALLCFLYPLYLLLVTGLLYGWTGSWLSLLVFLAFPVSARAWVQMKPQLD